MPKTVLITIGRLPKALDLVRSFAHAGYRVIVAEPFSWHLVRVSRFVTKTYTVAPPATQRARYYDDLLQIIERERVTLVVPASEETMYVSALAPRLPDGVRLFSRDQASTLRLHNKRAFIDFAASFGLPVPKTFDRRDPRAVPFAAANDYVQKPIFSCSGRGVWIRKAGEPLLSETAGEDEIVQQKIDGALFSTFSIAQSGRVSTTVVYRAAVMAGTVAVAFERMDGQTAIEQWIETFVARSNHTGFISFDMIVDRDGMAFAIECNPRATSGIHFVETADLAPAILDMTGATRADFKSNRLMQQFYPTLTETQKSFFSRTSFRNNLHHLFKARDVTWQANDPLPLLLMPMTAWQIISRSIRYKQSFGEASTFDISWVPD